MRLVSHSVDVVYIFNKIKEQVIEPRDSEIKVERTVEFLKKIKPVNLAPFLVADMETVLNEEAIHVPYAVGVLKVLPGMSLSKESIMC